MNLPESKIRPEFITQSSMLRNKIFMKIKPKTFNGKILSGQMLVELLESVVNAINEGAIPIIENSWNYITSNELLKSIKENTDYFKKVIMEYQKENLTRPDFFNELQKYSQSLIEDIINKFREENEKKFDDINEYVHKLKLSLNQEFRKLNEENISLIKDKYILDLDKEIGVLLQDKENLEKNNYISFISNLIQIKYKLDTTIPSFSLKDQISYDKIIETIKKYIEEYFVKPRNSIEQQIENLKMEYQFLENKYNNLNEESTKDKNEFKDTLNKYNDMLIESKLKIKTYEEKIKNFEAEKKTLKETNERTLMENNKINEEKIEKMNLEINKYKSEVKAKEEDLLVFKLNDEKVSALNEQKISFLEKELSQWKERYNAQGKELSESKSQIINLNSEIDKLKNENKNLKNKLEQGEGNTQGKSNENFKGTGNNFFSGTNNIGTGAGSSAGSKILIELLSGQNTIKYYIKEVMEKTNELVEKNKIIYENNVNISKFLKSIKGTPPSTRINNTHSSKKLKKDISNSSLNKDKEKLPEKEMKLTTKYNSSKNINDILEFNNIIINEPKISNNDNDKDDDNNININIDNLLNSNKSESNNEENSMNNDIKKNFSKTSFLNMYNNKPLSIKISNTVLKKDITGKPFLDYVCEIKNGDKNYTLNKKFGHFILLYKSLKLLFKDTLIIPDSGNLFMSITEMKQNTFHENKLTQLDKYINDLLAIEQVRNCETFRDFFELDEQHEQNNRKIRKNKTLIEKRKISKFASSNILIKDTSGI